MRLDKYLKVARVIKRRTIAKDISLLGFVQKEGKILKPSYEVKIGDQLTLILGERVLTIEVLALSATSKKADATKMFAILSEESITDPSLS